MMPPVIEKYLKFFPTVLFLCDDDIHSMHFILSLKHMSEAQQKKLVELMKHCGAEISFNVKDATDHSAIIVDHNEIVHFKAPAFTIKYIESCLEQLKVQNISLFRQDVTKHIAKDVKCMDVVYFRQRGWNSVLSKKEQLWFDEHIYSNISLNFSKPQASSSHDYIMSLLESRLAGDKYDGNSHHKEMHHKKNINYILSSDEDSDFEEINSHINLNEVHQGASVMQKNSTVGKPGSDNSKTIKENNNLQTITRSSTSRHGTAINSDNIKSVKRKLEGETNSTKSTVQSSNKWTFLDDFQPESSDEEVPPTVVKKKKEMFLDDFQPESSDKEVPPTVVKKKEENFFDFEIANENLNKPKKDKKHTRMPYSFEEQSKILNYVIEHNEFSRVKGRELWTVMERRKICPNRTWQSMKEHFLKKIIYSLDSFDFLTQMDKKKLKTIIYN